jgi:hypothetical protein
VALIAGIAIAALAGSNAPAPAASQDGVVWVSLCHGGAIRLPLSTGQRREPGKSWPTACHAFCLPTRKGSRRAADPGGEPA